MTHEIWHRTRVLAIATMMIAGLADTAMAVDPGVGVGAPGPGVTPGPGVGAPGVGARDPGVNQPGAAGNTPAPGVSVVDPGLNQPGVAGNVNGVARRSVRR